MWKGAHEMTEEGTQAQHDQTYAASFTQAFLGHHHSDMFENNKFPILYWNDPL